MVYKATVSLENVISSCTQCKVEMVLWSSGIEDDVDNNDANRGFEETHFSRHIGKSSLLYTISNIITGTVVINLSIKASERILITESLQKF